MIAHTRWTMHTISSPEPKETSVDNRVQICARFIVQEAANRHKYISERAKLLQSIAPLECVQKHSGSTRLNFLEIHRRLKPADNLFDVSELRGLIILKRVRRKHYCSDVFLQGRDHKRSVQICSDCAC